jgi:hypothetical protein
MAHSIPKARDGTLHRPAVEGTPLDPIPIGTAAWFSWLEQHRAFSFETGGIAMGYGGEFNQPL